MNTRTKTGLEILQVAIVLGLLGDILLRMKPWGLNALLFNVAFVAALVMLLRRHAPERLTLNAFGLMGAQLFFAAMFVWRDSNELKVVDTLAIVGILGVLFLPTLKISARVAGVFQYAASFVWAGLNSLFGTAALFGADIKWSSMSNSGWRRTAIAVVRGVLIALPLLIIFGALFVAADAVYEGWVRHVFNIDFEVAFSHLVLFALFAWLTAGYFRGIVFAGAVNAVEQVLSIIPSSGGVTETSPMAKVRAESGEHPVVLPDNKTVVEHINTSDGSDDKAADTTPGSSAETSSSETSPTSAASKPKYSWANIDNSIVPGFTLGTVEIGVVLGLLNLLFLSFVIVQVPYLFGGMDLVQNTPDFKLAEYARRGFGELVAVSALVLPILLASHWLVRKDAPRAAMLFRVLAGIQIALLFVIMASAVQRIVLLTGNLGYGMTTVRLYPLIFMTWLAVVFLWFGVTVLRGARQYFAWGALWSAFFIAGATHVLNPDEFIVKHNLALMREGREFDAGYNASLSADAVQALVSSLGELSVEDQCSIKWNLHNKYRSLGESGDLRSLNWSRKNGWYLLNRSDVTLHETEGCPAWIVSDYERSDGLAK